MSRSSAVPRGGLLALATLGLTCLGLGAAPGSALAAGGVPAVAPVLRAAAVPPAADLGLARVRDRHAPVTAAAVVGSALTSGQTLAPGDALQSPSGRYSLVMATDGHLLLEKATSALSPTPYDAVLAVGAPGSRLVLQTDGNVVLYAPDGTVAFATSTFGAGARRLVVQDDGNVVLYDAADGPLYASGLASDLQNGGTLLPGESLVSQDGGTVLALQTDGNLVLYRAGQVRYASGTGGPVLGLVVQDDGNVVLYAADHTPLLATGTVGAFVDLAVEDGEFRVFEIGNAPHLVVVGYGSAWATPTVEPGQVLLPGDRRAAPGGVQLVLQTDGNLVEYVNGRARFATGTPADLAVMQPDGNFVLYTASAAEDTTFTPRFQTGTQGHPGSRLVVQADANVVVYAPTGQALFATHR